MSVSALPEWKQLLLERKRREEEERERREREEEDKLASMPAWKRSLLQRRKRARQEEKGGGEVEALSDTDSSQGVPLGSERSLSPDPAPLPPPPLDPAPPLLGSAPPQRADSKLPHDRVSLETIVPVHENPFVRKSESGGWQGGGREGEAERGSEPRGEAERERPVFRGQEGLAGRGGAGGGSVTELRASDVLIIKHPSVQERGALTPGGGAEGGEEQVRGAAPERGPRVSQLLSRFGERRLLTCRSKSSESFAQLLRGNGVSDGNREPRVRGAVNGGEGLAVRGVPRRSVSFSDRAGTASPKSNGRNPEVPGVQGVPGVPGVQGVPGVRSPQWASEQRGNLADRHGSARQPGLVRDGPDAGEGRKSMPTVVVVVRPAHDQTRESAALPPAVDRRSLEAEHDAEGDRGFVVVPVRNTEGISFARRVPIQRSSLLCTAAAMAAAAAAVAAAPCGGGGSGPLPTRAVTSGPSSGAGAGAGEPPRGALETGERDASAGRLHGEAPPPPLEVQIPRTVFYVAEDPPEGRGRSQDGGGSVERRDSWRIGKPLSRVESLREKIRQREREKEREREREAKGERDSLEGVRAGLPGSETLQGARSGSGAETPSRRPPALLRVVVGGEEPEERLAAGGGGGQEVLGSQASADVTQEVCTSESNPPLPVSVRLLQEEVGGAMAWPGSEPPPGAPQNPADADRDGEHPDLLRHVEEELRRHVARYRPQERAEETGAEDEEAARQEGDCCSSPDFSSSSSSSSESISGSPPCPDPLGEMSRIYKVEAVSAARARSFAGEQKSPVHLLKVTPRMPQVLFGAENFRLPEQSEEKDGSSSPHSQRSAGPMRAHEPVQRRDWRAQQQQRDQGSSSPTPRTPAWSQPTGSPSTGPTSLSPGGSGRPSEAGPTPFSSPVQCSPAHSPCNSPSPPCTSSAASLFSVRSASRGQGSRAATTITITPRQPTAGGGGGGDRGVVAGVTTAVVQPLPSITQPPPAPAVELANKRFPKVEEIEVIGGYQSLERSCLVKNRGSPKAVRVCFSQARLEQVCEYPSEASMMAVCPPHPDCLTPQETEEEGGWYEEEDDDERGTRGPGTAATRVLKVEESGPR